MELCAPELSGNFAEMATSTPFRDLLHAANLRHGTDGFTSPPKALLPPEKSLRLRPCLNPRTWVLKGSTLPLDHRSRFTLPQCMWNPWSRLQMTSSHTSPKEAAASGCCYYDPISNIINNAVLLQNALQLPSDDDSSLDNHF